MLKRVLVIDDEKNILVTIKGALEDEGFVVETAASGTEGLDRFRSFAPDVVLLDIWLPDHDGLVVLEQVSKLDPTAQVIMMSGHGTIETAVKALKRGAFDFLEKPLHFDKLLQLLKHVFQLKELQLENRYLREELEEESLIANSEASKQLAKSIESLGPSGGWVHIWGENGSGKELVARLLHQKSPRAHRRFVKVNCSQLSETNIRELFEGLKEGTDGAPGYLLQAEGGSLVLEGADEMSLAVQGQLLKILEGSVEDIRVMALSNRNLAQRVKEQTFLPALYARLNAIPLVVPALRERREDVPFLVERFLKRYSGGRVRRVSEPTMRFLQTYPWPGNVRELKNWIERACILSNTELLDIFDWSQDANTRELDVIPYEGKSLRGARASFEKQFIVKMLSENGGNISKTAQKIGLERSYLHKKMKSYGIEVPAIQ